MIDLIDGLIYIDNSVGKDTKDLLMKILNSKVNEYKVSNDYPSKGIVIIKGYDLVENEGFKISSTNNVVSITARNDRGLMFGLGYLLRHSDISEDNFLFESNFELYTSPKYEIRGHQIGYRTTANTWDGWTKEQYEEYIRDLAIFGSNAVENIPFPEEVRPSHMIYSYDEMNKIISLLCKEYLQDYWVWIPALEDLRNEESYNKLLNLHINFYKNTPHLNGIFIPGGDPGHNHPKYLMNLIKEVYPKLKEYHPNAGIWLSLQGYTEDRIEYVLDLLNGEKPDYIEGIVAGPSSIHPKVIRDILDSKYKIRDYPDISHTCRCQHPVKNWDQAFALTEGRESCNPQPKHYYEVFKNFTSYCDGFITYSDGAHDDFNKVLYSLMGWDDKIELTDIVNQYSRFFFGSENISKGIFMLEGNWDGPIHLNETIDKTYQLFNELDNMLIDNWRYNFIRLRAYYDYYIKQRSIYEKKLEEVSMTYLMDVNIDNIDSKMKAVLDKVNEAETLPINIELKTKILNILDLLHQQIMYQSDKELYYASGYERSCLLTFLDYPLNNRWWLTDEFNKIKDMNDEEKLERIELIRTWDNPGIDSYYDNVSHVGNSPHVLTSTNDLIDVAWWDEGFSRKRLSTQLFQRFPKLKYENLEPNERYLIRISGYGECLIRANGVRLIPMVYDKELGEIKEFLVPKSINNGELIITFDEPEESYINWRHQSKVSDVWLINIDKNGMNYDIEKHVLKMITSMNK